MDRIRALFFCFLACLAAGPLAGQTANDGPWLELQSASLGLRYRLVENQFGSRAQNWSDHHEGLKLRLKLDRSSRPSWPIRGT